MRLSAEEIQVIKKSVQEFDPDANVYVFGSRTNDQAKGGDIDILVLSEIIGLHEKMAIRRNFIDTFGEQKIDIVLDSHKKDNIFVKKIFDSAIAL